MKQIDTIKITPKNYEQWDIPLDCIPVGLKKSVLALFNATVNDYIDNQLASAKIEMPPMFDAGSEYASFLRAMHLNHESDNGWWSLGAIKQANIDAFLNYITQGNSEDAHPHAKEFAENYELAKRTVKKLDGLLNNPQDFNVYTRVSKLSSVLKS